MVTSTISEINNIWNKTLKIVEQRLNDRHIYDTFFSLSRIHKIDGNKMIIVLNSKLAIQIIETKYKVMLDEIIQEVTSSNYELQFITEADIENEIAKVKSSSEKKKFFQNSVINTKYTFDTFVVGQCNREASQAAVMIASAPGKSFNPLFIYSQSGLGKTHLLHAIGNYIRENNPLLNVLYISTDDFIDEFIKSVRGDNEIEELKEYFRTVDVLLIDDIQFLAQKNKTAEMFFNIFNIMINNGKQIVLTSDCHPNNLKGLEQRLVTRFNAGLSIDIKSPDKETLLQILKLKIEANDLDINNFDNDVLEFFATKFSNNVRELEGAINRLLFYTINIKQCKRITMQVAIDSVSSIINVRDTEALLNEDRIIEVVADYYNLTVSQLKGNARTSQLALARHIAMYLIRSLLDVPFTKIGSVFGGKDHSTVMSAVNKVEKMLKTNASYNTAIVEIKKLLKVENS